MTTARPAPRVPVDLELRVWGMGADGRIFSQHARARNVSIGGALISDIDRDLKIGDTIGVQRGEKKARCKVIWTLNTRSAEKIRAGVQLLSEKDCPWTALLPKTDESTPIPAKGTRRWERHKILQLIALYEQRAAAPMRVTATDISASGCYVETISPFAMGTSLTVDLRFGTERILTRAFVRASDPGVGMGIEFVGLTTDEQRRFQEYLRAMNPWARSIERQKQAQAATPTRTS
jgi:PilZ domain